MEKYTEAISLSSRCIFCADVFTCKKIDTGNCSYFRMDKVLRDAGICKKDMEAER
jgi:hypothetical protein